MSYRNPQNPCEVRTVLQTLYDRYATGLDMFPRVRWQAPADTLPRKSQAVGIALESAWARIDEDEAYFRDAISSVADLAVAKVAAGETDGGLMLAITQVGRNCVKMATITPKPGKPEAMIGVFPRNEFVEQFEGFEFNVNGGRKLTLVNGEMQMEGGGPDLAVVRGSNVSGVYLPQSPTLPGVDTIPVVGDVL